MKGESVRFNVMWADWQLGKSGTTETIDRIEVFTRSYETAYQGAAAAGPQPRVVARANMGDPREGCYGQYESQLFTTELTEREQTTLTLDLWSSLLLDLVESFGWDDVEFASVLCRPRGEVSQGHRGPVVHVGQRQRGGMLPELLERIIGDRHDITWNIPTTTW